MPIFNNDDEFEEIPRSRLLTAPKIMMFSLVFEHLGEMSEKIIVKILKRSSSQVSTVIRKLVNQGFITVKKIGRENRIRATELGIIHIQEYKNNSFKQIIGYFNFLLSMGEIDEEIHNLIDLVNSVLKNQNYYQKIKNQFKIEKKKAKMDYYQRVYDRVENGNMDNFDNLIEEIFDFLNKNPCDYYELQPNFENENPQTVKQYYNLWLKFTSEKDRKGWNN